MSDLRFSIHATAETAARTRVTAREFSVIVDEPPELGGTNEGPNPVEYVLAALAGCLNVVGHLVAGELGFTLHGLEIEAEGELNPARLMNQPTEDRAGYKVVRVVLKPTADVDDALLARWLKIVESRCPVSDTVGNDTPVNLSVRKKD
ncbi:MAG: OsmC family protein [Kiritimatiellia bacterium]|nr:OsmC family protein [Kiritimatiellia bacterium]